MPLVWEPKIIALKVRNFNEVKSFYKAVLSLRVIEDVPGVSISYDLGNIVIMLVKDELFDFPEDFGRSMEIMFTVRSFGGILEILQKLNVEYEMVNDESSEKLNIKDPEGRVISFLLK